MASTILLQSTQGFVDFTGDPVRADGYYGFPDSLYTIAISTQNFIGRITIEASLALDPQDTLIQNDWFPVQLIELQDYIDFPIIPTAPSGLNGGDTATQGFSFRGNFLYLRAVVQRSQIFPNTLSPEQIELLGTTRIVLSQSQTTYSSSTTLPPVTGFTQLSNSGTGYQIYAGQNAAGVPVFRTLVAGTGITISQTATTLTITDTAAAAGLGDGDTTGSEDDNGTSFESGDTFITLNDTPASYIGFANNILQVNTAGTGIVFSTLPALATSGSLNDATGVLSVAQGGTGIQTLSPSGILIADSTGLVISFIPAPTVANSVLTWDGTSFDWSSSAGGGGTVLPTIPSPTLNVEIDLANLTPAPAVTSILGDIGVVTLSDLVEGGLAPLYSNISIMTVGNTLVLTGVEQFVIVNKNVGSITTITLPLNPLSGNMITIKDGKGDSMINAITVGGNGKVIDGLPYRTINIAYGVMRLIYNGTSWNMI